MICVYNLLVLVGYNLGIGIGASHTTLENKMEIYFTTINLLKQQLKIRYAYKCFNAGKVDKYPLMTNTLNYFTT